MARKPLTAAVAAPAAEATPSPAAKRVLNPEPPILTTLVLDSSGSMEMSGALAAAVAALPGFRNSVLEDTRLSRVLEWSFVIFSDETTVMREFGPIGEWEPPGELQGGSGTRMGSALLEALRLQETRVQELTGKGIGYRYRFLVLVTDGQPNSEWPEVFDEAARRIQDEEKKGRFGFFPIGVEDADFAKLAELTKRRAPLKLASIGHFSKLLGWVLGSMSTVVRSRVGEKVELPPPLVSQDPIEGWGTMPGDPLPGKD